MDFPASPAPLVDIGANLTHDSFDRDRDDVLKRAHAANVTSLVLTGTDRASIEQSLALLDRYADTPAGYPQLVTTAGVHPHHADEWSASLEADIQRALSRPDVVAVGECGLDYFRDFTPRATQRATFEAQLTLAATTGAPLFLHERDASHDMIEMLTHWRDDIGNAVVHCFTGDKATLYAYLDLDMHIGLTGWVCDERRGAHLHPLVQEIPANRLMIETDCPYLLPRDLPVSPKGRRHEPALLPWINTTLARLRHCDEETLARQTTHTAERFFSLTS